MATNTITSDDTISLYGRVITGLADGDTSVITFPNNLTELKTGKNRNTVFVRNVTGENAELVLRVIRGCSDDIFLQSKLSASQQDFASSELASGEFVKRLGDGLGNVIRDVYTMSGGIITKNVEGKENVEGDTTQAVATYNFKFATAGRSIQ